MVDVVESYIMFAQYLLSELDSISCGLEFGFVLCLIGATRRFPITYVSYNADSSYRYATKHSASFDASVKTWSPRFVHPFSK